MCVRKSQFLCAIISITLCISCSFFKSPPTPEISNDNTPPEQANAPVTNESEPIASPIKGNSNARSLIQAKLWNRVDELEEELLRQKERLKLIEKGLTLGLVPPELTDTNLIQKKIEIKKVIDEPKPEKKSTTAVLTTAEDSPNVVVENPKSTVKADDKLEYDRKLGIAQDHFRSGRYGRAIAEYSGILRDFPEASADGEPKYWVAISWSHLKELQTARQHLDEFLQEYPSSKIVPRAKVEMARIEIRLGLRERAVERLRMVIRDYPNEDAAEIAKMEMKSLEKSL